MNLMDQAHEKDPTPSDLIDKAKAVPLDFLLDKSKKKYLYVYNKFLEWKLSTSATSFSEDVLLAYFDHLSKSMKSPTLWSIYSMLKSTLSANDNVNIEGYKTLIAFIKEKNIGYSPTLSQVLTYDQVQKFFNEAPDYEYLASKAILAVGLAGALRRKELCSLLNVDVIEPDSTMFLVKLNHSRSFAITDDFYKIVKKYTNLRPKNCKCPKFFINYQKGKCLQQPIGINKIGMVPKQIAEYLKLPNPESYNGHAFRRTSESFHTSVKRHGGCKTNKIDGHPKDSVKKKIGIEKESLPEISNEIEKCLICSEKNNRMVSLRQTLEEYDDLTLAQILNQLQFLTISDINHRFLCFICTAQVFSSYDFKMKCKQIGNGLNLGSNQTSSSTYHQFQENPNKNDNFDSVSEENMLVVSEIPELNFKWEIDKDDGVFDINEEKPNIVDNYETGEMEMDENDTATDNLFNKSQEVSTEGIFGLQEDVKEENMSYEKTFICPVCSKSFKTKHNMQTHYLIHTGEKPHVCDVCNKSFRQLTNLYSHKLVHTNDRPYSCDECNKSYISSSSLTKHKLIHTGERPYVCDVCDKSFSQSGNLNKHKVVHTGERPYVCDVCNKSFTQSSNLSIHKLIHTGEEPFSCDVCNKRFNHPSILAQHRLIHSSEKLYVCDVCNKSFTQSSNLNTHKLIHSGIKPYVCDVCNKAFTHNKSLIRHRTIHGDTQACGMFVERCDSS